MQALGHFTVPPRIKRCPYGWSPERITARLCHDSVSATAWENKSNDFTARVPNPLMIARPNLERAWPLKGLGHRDGYDITQLGKVGPTSKL
jgi:hypothetical protein